MRDRAPRRTHDPITFMLAGDEAGDPDLARLEAALEIDAADIPEAFARQPALYYRAALRAARLEAQVEAAAAEARAAEDRVVMYLRAQLSATPDGASVETRARQHVDVYEAARRLAEARRLGGIATALRSAYAQRLRALEGLAQILAARPSRPPR